MLKEIVKVNTPKRSRALCTKCKEGTRLKNKPWCQTCTNAYQNKWRLQNLPQRKAQNKVYREQLKSTVYSAYGNACNWCRESDPMVLVIDHVLNDGASDRKRNFRGTAFHRHIIKTRFPNRYQLLCANCNMAKAMNGGVLPESRKKDA